jgi:hypothetical protein
MIVKSRVKHFFHSGMGSKSFRDNFSICLVFFHAHKQVFYAALGEPRVKRRECRAIARLGFQKRIRVLIAGMDDEAEQGVVMTRQVLAA